MINYSVRQWYDVNKQLVNIDICNRCPLECLQCSRQTNKPIGRDLTIEEFAKVCKKFTHISFCGQYSDPVHHPKFIEFLKMCNDNPSVQSVEVHHASGYKKMDWYVEAFKSCPKAKWIFGIDGYPIDKSIIYRKNQRTKILYQAMIESKKYLNYKPTWQYIVFKYNEDHVIDALNHANEIGVKFNVVYSSRDSGPADLLKPTKRML